VDTETLEQPQQTSNRFRLVDRENLRGAIAGVDFGSNVSCIARSPTAALLWSGGGGYWSGRGMPQAYAPSHLIGIVRIESTSRMLKNYHDVGDKGGRLTPERITDAADKITELFQDKEVAAQIVIAVREKKTLIVEDGGPAFEPKWRFR
jgi:hypothetical protein